MCFTQFYCDLCGLLIVGINVGILVASKGNIDVALAAFSLCTSANIIGFVSLFSKYALELYVNFISVQRLIEYQDMESEKLEGEGEINVIKGEIRFSGVYMKYQPNLPYAIYDLSLKIKPGQKIGIVGRTGSGKSSIVQVLCRLTEPDKGTIYIDGQDYLSCGIHDLRKQISVIPQSAILFSTTIRNNLDPFLVFSDADLLKVLELVGLGARLFGQENFLDEKLGEKGISLSAGQRQLLCLARAVLLKNKIVVLDEATSNVDMQTDEIMQKIIKEEFKGATILVIAHRLQTAIDSDKVIVMDSGMCAEFDRPKRLMENKESILYEFAMNCGIRELSIGE
jgi:ATP-binding cassette subfamily C (CFTR/MRP) protein 1